jgi:uncharacterized RDD family membrane protein YckC
MQTSPASFDRGLIGCRSVDRYFAAIIDDLFACAAGFVAAVKLAQYGTAISWTAAGTCYFGYYFLWEMLFSNTPGKWFSGLRLRTVSGARCTRTQILIRTLMRLVEVNPVLFGGLPAAIAIFVTPRRQRLGDAIAGTVVVRQSLLT